MAKILAFAGSARRDSANKKLLTALAAAARDAGGDVTQIDLADFDIPLFNEDIESAGVPADVTRLKKLAADHDAFLISSPEYNGSISPLIKNTIDWLSRKHGDEPRMMAYSNKVVALSSASPGGLGGIRMLPQLQYIFQSLGVLVIPQTVAVGGAFKAFDEDGKLVDEKIQERVAAMAKRLVETTRALQK